MGEESWHVTRREQLRRNASSQCFLPLSPCEEFQVVAQPEPEAEEEFVPEPDTMLLLGSGLAGLAG